MSCSASHLKFIFFCSCIYDLPLILGSSRSIGLVSRVDLLVFSAGASCCSTVCPSCSSLLALSCGSCMFGLVSPLASLMMSSISSGSMCLSCSSSSSYCPSWSSFSSSSLLYSSSSFRCHRDHHHNPLLQSNQHHGR